MAKDVCGHRSAHYKTKGDCRPKSAHYIMAKDDCKPRSAHYMATSFSLVDIKPGYKTQTNWILAWIIIFSHYRRIPRSAYQHWFHIIDNHIRLHHWINAIKHRVAMLHAKQFSIVKMCNPEGDAKTLIPPLKIGHWQVEMQFTDSFLTRYSNSTFNLKKWRSKDTRLHILQIGSHIMMPMETKGYYYL